MEAINWKAVTSAVKAYNKLSQAERDAFGATLLAAAASTTDKPEKRNRKKTQQPAGSSTATA